MRAGGGRGSRTTSGSRAGALCLLVALPFVPVPAQPLTPLVPPPAPPAPSVEAVTDSAQADSLAALPVARADTARVVMHHFNHRQQIITGGAIMTALAAIMVVMNNYNPRVPQ